MNASSIEDKIKELESKREKIAEGGGAKRIEQQHEKGKLTARERLEQFLDTDSFVEIDAFMQHRAVELGMDKVDSPGDGVVTGYGTVENKLVYVFAQDFTVRGGTLGEMHAQKICKVMDMASRMGAPLIGMNDSGGARIQEGVDALKGFGEIFFRNTRSSGVIPQLSIILGPCAGGAVYSPAITDFVFMVKGTSNMFITGPQVIKEVTGEEISAEQLGGAVSHSQLSGVAHFVSETESECFLKIRELLSYLPSNNLEDPPLLEPSDDPGRTSEKLRDIIPADPNKAYDVTEIISEVVDNGDYLEVHPLYARNMVTCFARLNGRSIGIIANQPQFLAGCLDINASDKAARFIRFCDCYNIPLLTLSDVPGYLPGTSQEHGGIIRHGAKILYAYSEATVPKMTVILRKAYGGAYIAMCSKHLGSDFVLSWPSAEIAVMGPEGAANIIFRKEINESSEPEETRKQKITEYREEFANPYKAGRRGYVEDIILPEFTRPRLINILESIISKREELPPKKHGNIPL
jgi:acetyl-CoA carboxylase carboxyltransferase component